MGVQNPNSTSYVHPDEPNLLNLHKAMVYRDDEPHLRVTLGGDNITITGNVNLVDTVRINNTEAQMIPVYLVGNVLTVNQGTTPWYANANVIGNISGITTLPAIRGNVGVSGNVNVDNFPSNVFITQMPAVTGNVGVSGNVSITQMPAVTGNVWVNGITGNIAGITTLPLITGNVGVSGNVDIGRMPGITGNVGVSGNVSITQMPGITGNVGVSGNVKIEQMPGITGNVGVSGNVDVTRMPAVTGNVQVWDGGNSITVDGNVSITQMPAVTGTVTMITDANAAPVVSFADTVQMDSNDRLRVSVIGQQWWYVPSVDKDGDLRIIEKFQGTGASTTFIQNLASVRLTSGLTYNANTQLTGTTVRASRRRHKTRPGVTSEWIGIVNWDGLQTNVVKRIGMFTNYNGYFFEANATHINTVIRKRLTDGTLVESRTPHTAWSRDQMNGSGPSGYNWNSSQNITANVTSVVSQANVAVSGDGNVYQVTYQITSGEETRIPVGQKVTLTGLSPTSFNDTGLVTSIDTVNHRANVAYVEYPGTYISATAALMTHTPFHHIQHYWFDLNGSRTGRVRFGLMTDAGKVIVHESLLGEQGTQSASAPALMDRKEIVNTGQPVGFLPSLTVAGSAVTIETQADINPGFGVAQTPSGSPVVFDKNADVGKEWALLSVGIRIGEPYQRADLQVNSLQIVDLGNLNPQNAGIFQWRLVLNPTFAGTSIPSITNVGKATRAYYYSAGTTVSGGITLISGYSQGTYANDVRTALNFLNMGSNVDYTDTDLVVLCLKYLVKGTDNSSMVGTISYTEDL